MGIDLFEHNKTAYNEAISMLDVSGKAAVIHPTGTGKSFIAFKLCEDHPDKKICWLSPSDYIFRTQVENWKSAENKGSSEDKWDFSENGVEKAKGNSEAGRFSPVLPNVRFYTYAKLRLMDEAALSQLQPDYIILDEFHRCGASQWGGGVERLREMYPDAKVLGLSATNIRYLDNQRDMAWELFDGNIASELTLGEAIVRGILPTPKYVLSIYSYQKELKRYEAKVRQAKNKAVRDKAERQLEALRRALQQADGLEEVFARHIKPFETVGYTSMDAETGKDNAEQHPNEGFHPDSVTTTKTYGRYLVFCANYDHLNEMKELAVEWFAKVDPAPHIYTIYSDDPDTGNKFQAFQADHSSHLKLLYCIDMLNEGIHIDVDGVILLRPTVSPTIYKQQIGRALASGRKKTPVIFDIVMNIENLYSIGAVEEEVREAVLSYRAAGREKELAGGPFTIIDEVQDSRKLFRQLNETLGASWDAMYAMAEEYARKHGNLDVPKRYRTPDGYSLGMWLSTQKKVYAGKVAGNLSQTQVKKLEQIGMNWQGKRELAWEKHYAEAADYYKKYGNLLAGLDMPERPENDGGGTPAVWDVSKEKIRESVREENPFGMAENQFAIAETAGKKTIENAVKHTVSGNFEKFMVSREEPKKIGGTPLKNPYAGLARWLNRMRVEWKKIQQKQNVQFKDLPGSDSDNVADEKDEQRQNSGGIVLTPERIARLTAIGMVWNAPDLVWEQHFAAAERYSKEHGNLDVPSYYVDTDGIRLGTWLAKQRKLRNQGEENGENHKLKISREQIKRLTDIGMVWEGKHHATWETSYAAACEYYRKHGNLDVPAGYVTKDGCRLGRWIRRQRDWYQERVMEHDWKEDGGVGIDTEENQKNKKHQNAKQGDSMFGVYAARVEKLEQIGMVWEKDDPWEQRYRLAKTYYEEHGNLKLPGDYVVEGVWLDRWLRAQRARLQEENEGCEGRQKGSLLTELQKEKLACIGILPGISQAEECWRQQYGEAEKFYRKHGNLSIPKRYVATNGKNLGVWLQHQREGKRNGRLSGWQVTMMENIGMVWEFDDPWEAGFCHAEEYARENGNLEVPNAYVCGDGYRLGKWISNQRCAYRGVARKGLGTGQIRRLEEIGMVWSAKQGRGRKIIS